MGRNGFADFVGAPHGRPRYFAMCAGAPRRAPTVLGYALRCVAAECRRYDDVLPSCVVE
ncbi:MAG: hypothetical protein FWE47_03550 [Oscillospiraceae bacterium]|nr:hypothetical protein [Oscillospiraceae bacterium]